MSKKQLKPASLTKTDKILKLLQRNTGATIAELAKVTRWQRHSVHGFMSGTLKKKRGLEIKTTKEENKDCRYFGDGNSK
jgi:Protein of unknown function (DUF3489)